MAVLLIIRGKHCSEAIGGLTSWECWFLLLQFGLKWEKQMSIAAGYPWYHLVPFADTTELSVCVNHKAFI